MRSNYNSEIGDYGSNPIHSTSPVSKQIWSLQMPDFSHVSSLKVCPGVPSFLGYGRCGKVFKGLVDGVRVAVKVSFFSLFILMPLKYDYY